MNLYDRHYLCLTGLVLVCPAASLSAASLPSSAGVPWQGLAQVVIDHEGRVQELLRPAASAGGGVHGSFWGTAALEELELLQEGRVEASLAGNASRGSVAALGVQGEVERTSLAREVGGQATRMSGWGVFGILVLVLSTLLAGAALLWYLWTRSRSPAQRPAASPARMERPSLGGAPARPHTGRKSIQGSPAPLPRASRWADIVSEHMRPVRKSIFQGVEDFNPLAPEYTVQKPDGQTFSLTGLVHEHPQETTVMLAEEEQPPLIYAFISEREGGGILLESKSEIPIAYLDTTQAFAPVGPQGRQSQGGDIRHVSIVRLTDGQEPDSPPFAVVIKGQGQSLFQMIHCTEDGQQGSLELSIVINQTKSDVYVKNIFAKDNRLLAKVAEGSGREQAVLSVGEGVDVALIWCAVLAANKLQ